MYQPFRTILQTFCISTCIVLTALPAFSKENDIVGVASVTDGDTLEIHGTKIRLHGVDAPESSQMCLDKESKQYRCGQRSALALSDMIGRKTVTCTPINLDRYGRTVAKCFVGDVNINAWLVENGFARAYQQYSKDYVALENAAQNAKIGIWQGQFEDPWDYRKAKKNHSQKIYTHTLSTKIDAPAIKTSKGNFGFTCGGKSKCGQMSSCDEAKFYLNHCGLGRLDGDHDGTPCESICR
jgi:endonuclease YncB( thermonuclease family)